ncbi:ankyrin repeat protein [Ancylostoma duodenale]|uniref:Ankyrin repeat protein n=1 Tax=Ancylostoma duodenale TaxID=51022 RepID=A0A0C2H1A2_9BILA|nr:ankyrin repeat protein [Ancylostoma duodenale]
MEITAKNIKIAILRLKYSADPLTTNSIVDAPAEHVVDEWLASGDVAKLEQLVLDGRGHLLKEKTAVNAASKEFLRGLTVYQSKIDAIHKAVEDGDVRRVKSLIDRQQLALARDSYGMTPLHKALLHGQTNTVRHLLAKYPQCVNATDHSKNSVAIQKKC